MAARTGAGGWWGVLWRSPALVDGLLGYAVAMAVGVAVFTSSTDSLAGSWPAYLFALGFGVLLLFRRRHSVLVLVLRRSVFAGTTPCSTRRSVWLCQSLQRSSRSPRPDAFASASSSLPCWLRCHCPSRSSAVKILVSSSATTATGDRAHGSVARARGWRAVAATA
jgi:hypothetical protein